ncbi:unnamed protein product [Clonostachys rosea f. rosea IK726]|uniref:Azaphilone pigments biosynthesis cluster protein L N-terminal domain-containing protein n=2 Tax=Bionectria ochroleuca TaxID=29856 RepID=A0A0B7KSQ4_BIOOC|nr:unnamed protein product [Clonostachys rosea f. rosea IK726]
MGDPLSIASSVVALVTFALQSSVVLYSTVRSFQSQDRDVRALKGELNDLTTVLECLLDTVTNHPELDFAALKTPLHRCGKACEEYGDIITRCTKHSTGSRPSIRDWITQKYLQGDIDDFRAMLAGYKSTINIALANANIHAAAITPKALEDYKDLISDTSNDLQEHMRTVEAKFQLLLNNNEAKGKVTDALEWEAILEEKASTQQGLSICAQLSLQIEQFGSTTRESPGFGDRSSAHKLIRSGLNSAKGSIQSLVTRLQIHENDIEKQLAALVSSTHDCENNISQLTQLQQTKDSLRQCIEIVSDASETLMDQRRNVFEDITMADDSYDFSVSTVGDLVTARRLTLKGRSRHVGGQISDESYQRTVDAITRLDMENARISSQNNDPDLALDRATPMPQIKKGKAQEGFSNRHGRGVILSPSTEGA